MNNYVPDDIGKRIREFRKKRELSMRELGRAIGVSEQAISQYELGKRPVTSDTIRKICKTLNVPVEKLFLGDDSFWNEGDEGLFGQSFERDMIIMDFDKMNRKGQKKAYEFISDLAQLPKYQKKEGESN